MIPQVEMRCRGVQASSAPNTSLQSQLKASIQIRVAQPSTNVVAKSTAKVAVITFAPRFLGVVYERSSSKACLQDTKQAERPASEHGHEGCIMHKADASVQET